MVRTSWFIAVLSLCSGCSPPLEGIEVTENPASVLSCWMRWSTDEPASSRVEFGEGDELSFAVGEDVLVTEHEVLVFGMRPGRTYGLEAVSRLEAGGEMRGERLDFETGQPPFADLITEVTALEPDRIQPGWTLTNVNVRAVNYPATAVIFDSEGEPIWYHQHGDEDGRADLEVSLVQGDHVLIGAGVAPGDRAVEVDMAGTTIWEGPQQPDDSQLVAPGAMHHSFTRLPGGDTLVLTYEGKDDDLFDVIEQLDPDLEVVWSWTGEELEVDTYPWGNAVLTDPDRGVTYYNARMTSTLYQLDRDDGSVLWRFGEDGDFAADPDAEHPWPHEAHAPEFQADGNLLLYDNGGASRDVSRVVEYALNPDAMTSEIVWEYPGDLADDPWSTTAMGDADRLANGNTLVTAGSLIAGDSPSRIFEVTPDGGVVWEMWMSGDGEDVLAASYMAERIPVLVEEL